MATALLASDDQNPEFTGARNPDSALAVRFYNRPVQNNVESSVAGRPIFQDIVYVEIMIPGNSLSIIDTPVREEHKRRFPLQWANFQNANGGATEVVGTPITSWPFLSRAQAEELKAIKFLTVEMLANASDGQLQSIGMVGGMNAHVMRERAKAYLAAAKGSAPTEHLAASLAEAKKMIEQQQAQINALLASSSGAKIEKQKKPRKEREPLDPELLAAYTAKFNRKPPGMMTNAGLKRWIEKG